MSGVRDTPMWQSAASFAARAHRGQLRKDGATPYAAHPTRVAMTVAFLFGFDDEEILVAALLHDVIEDTTVDYDDLLGHFGEECDLKRYGESIASRGGKNAKKRAVVAVARKLAVLLHRLWISDEPYDPDFKLNQKNTRKSA